jgi:hypothetical protein
MGLFTTPSYIDVVRVFGKVDLAAGRGRHYSGCQNKIPIGAFFLNIEHATSNDE